jgi:hypothetical protein
MIADWIGFNINWSLNIPPAGWWLIGIIALAGVAILWAIFRPRNPN